MAHTKAGGSTQNNRDSQPKFLGVKLYSGQEAKPGFIVLRQRGTKFIPGIGVKMGKDHTIFATTEGVVKFKQKQKIGFDGSRRIVNQVSVFQSSK